MSSAAKVRTNPKQNKQLPVLISPIFLPVDCHLTNESTNQNWPKGHTCVSGVEWLYLVWDNEDGMCMLGYVYLVRLVLAIKAGSSISGTIFEKQGFTFISGFCIFFFFCWGSIFIYLLIL